MGTEDRTIGRLPPWFQVRIGAGRTFSRVESVIRERRLHTVCESAACPNRAECWGSGTATFLILGDVCTRNCGFCNVWSGPPHPVDPEEPGRIADAVAALGLCYAVVTSVTRDDLTDGGAGAFAATVRAVRSRVPACRIEVLVPDFQGSAAALDAVLDACPDVLNHNLETVPSRYPAVRPGADFARSLALLERAGRRGIVTKSGLMLGLGERIDEVRGVMAGLRNAGCGILTIGQYLRPRKDRLPVQRYCHPDEFRSLRGEGLAMGFREVAAGPQVRSSYHAGAHARLDLP
jgi:lipoic acid synthetase